MRPLLVPILLASVFCGCQSSEEKAPETPVEVTKDTMATIPVTPTENNIITATEQADGWQLLFDGATKKNWHVYNHGSDGAAWKVADGALYLDPSQKKGDTTVGGGDLVSDEEYDNFHLKIDWKLDSAGNSGIIFNVKEDAKIPRTYHTGPEMQVLDNAAHPDAKIVKHRAGDLYDLITSSPEIVRPAGQWNEAEIISLDGVLEFFLNGTRVMSTVMWDDNWRKMIAASKFKEWKTFGTYKKGRIALQDHGDPVWYRNIRIRKLKSMK
jgi:hypothetical protein